MPYAQSPFSPLVEKHVTLGNIILIQQSTKPPRIGEEVFQISARPQKLHIKTASHKRRCFNFSHILTGIQHNQVEFLP